MYLKICPPPAEQGVYFVCDTKKQSGSCRNTFGLKFKKICVINLQQKRVKRGRNNIKNSCVYQTLIRSSGARYMPSPS